MAAHYETRIDESSDVDLEEPADHPDTANKRSGHEEDVRSPKARRGDETMTADLLRTLLSQSQEQMISAQKQLLDAAMGKLEERQATRFAAIETKADQQHEHIVKIEDAIKMLEARMGKVEEGSTQASSEQPSGTTDARRRLTLVIGGWPRDTKKAVILSDIHKAINALKLQNDLDEEPFCTGPRRSSALVPFKQRPGEDLSATRDRMHRFLNAFGKAKPPIAGQSKGMWCGHSKTKQERDISGHCSLTRAIVYKINGARVPDLECDYILGKTWLGSSVLSAFGESVPTADGDRIWRDERKQMRPWINISAIAKELQVTLDQVEKAITAALN